MVTELQQREDLDRLLEQSATARIMIFKHSTQCPVSTAAYDEFLEFTGAEEDVPCGVVLVIENRSLSNTIARELGVRHESPQAIVVEKGHLKWTASHWSITAAELRKAIKD